MKSCILLQYQILNWKRDVVKRFILKHSSTCWTLLEISDLKNKVDFCTRQHYISIEKAGQPLKLWESIARRSRSCSRPWAALKDYHFLVGYWHNRYIRKLDKKSLIWRIDNMFEIRDHIDEIQEWLTYTFWGKWCNVKWCLLLILHGMLLLWSWFSKYPRLSELSDTVYRRRRKHQRQSCSQAAVLQHATWCHSYQK